MPQPEFSYLYQRAVLWPLAGTDANGQPTVGAPEEVAVRWNTRRAAKVDAKGNSVSYDGTVVVAKDVADGSHMWLGTLAQWYALGSADQTGVVEVKSFDSTPDAKNRAVFRQLGVLRLHDKT